MIKRAISDINLKPSPHDSSTHTFASQALNIEHKTPNYVRYIDFDSSQRIGCLRGYIIMGFLAAVLVAITVFFLRKKKGKAIHKESVRTTAFQNYVLKASLNRIVSQKEFRQKIRTFKSIVRYTESCKMNRRVLQVAQAYSRKLIGQRTEAIGSFRQLGAK